MPLLGLFSKKHKSSARDGGSSSNHSTMSEAESVLPSQSTEYVPVDRSSPYSPNGKNVYHSSPSTSKLYPTVEAEVSKRRLHFGFKKSTGASSNASLPIKTDNRLLSPPHPSYLPRSSTSASSESDFSDFRKLVPPSKSAVFSANDGALSTRSLPNDKTRLPPDSSTIPRSTKKSFFHWNRSAPSTPLKALPPISTTSDDSFNLKSFRHIQASSPTHSNTSNLSVSNISSLPHRPRNSSTASDSSQRISVAAFREAQARRSAAGSPVPSFRAPSPHGAPSQPTGRFTPVSSGSRSPIPRSASQPTKVRRRSNLYASTSDSDESSEEEEEEEEEEDSGDANPKLGTPLSRRRTITQRSTSTGPTVPQTRITKSELGHGSSHKHEDSMSTVKTSRSQSTFHGHSNNTLGRPNTSKPNLAGHSRQPSGSHSDSSDSDDDAPLATLMAPKRPGSAMSNASNPSLRPKPLIDITTLTGPNRKPTFGADDISNDDAFTGGSTLLSGKIPARRNDHEPLVESPLAIDAPYTAITTKSLPGGGKFPSPPRSPVKRHEHSLPPNTEPMPPRTMPIRSSTDPNLLSNHPGAHSRTDINDRLARMAKQANISPASTSPKNTDLGPAGSSDGDETLKQRGHIRARSDESNKFRRASLGDIDDLADILGAGICLISRNGEEQSEEKPPSPSLSPPAPTVIVDPKPPATGFVPIPIQKRMPAPAFSVTSRPSHVRSSSSISGMSEPASHNFNPSKQVRVRSSTLIPSSISTMSGSSSTPSSTTSSSQQSGFSQKSTTASSNAPPSPNARPKMSKLQTASPRRSSLAPSIPSVVGSPTKMPRRPFATPQESPASSTGDSSSGRLPITPRDGSDIGAKSSTRPSGKSVDSKEKQWGGGVSGLGLNPRSRQHKSRTVSFDEERSQHPKVQETHQEGENRRRDRRRSEAKAAIELGNVINGRGPVLDEDDDEEDQPISQTKAGRMSNITPMITGPVMPQVSYGPPPGSSMWNGAWSQMQQQPQLLSPAQFMVPPPTDPAYYAAHQQAMMIAKQAYQIAVAQQAMAAAGDEWERGSSVGMGTGSVYGGSIAPSIISPQYSMNPGMGMGMGMGGNGWSTGSMIFPNTPRTSMFGGAQSDYGGSGGNNWISSRSVYGEPFGPQSERMRKSSTPHASGRPGMNSRESGYFPPMPPIPQSSQSSSPSRPRTVSQPSNTRLGPRRAPPPSSWKS